MKNLKRSLLSNIVLLCAASVAWSGQMSGGDYVITKDLTGATGSAQIASTDFSMAFAWGEPVSGNLTAVDPYSLISGYIGGRFGNGQTTKFLSAQIGELDAKTFFQDHVQVGVSLSAPVVLTFSESIDPATIADGIKAVVAVDHMGQATTAVSSFTFVANLSSPTVTLRPATAWLANTLYDIQITPQIISGNNFLLDDTYHVYFLTILNPREENVVLYPITAPGLIAASGAGTVGPLSISIPTESLAQFSAVLLSRDPVSSPLHADPKIIQEANEKAHAAGGDYRVPLSIQEISAYNAQGDRMGPLSKPAQVTISYGGGLNAPSAAGRVVRSQTLSIWALDEKHKLWVKIPASQNALGFHTVTAPITSFTTFALMGSADGSASDSYAFPVPWRPHGPKAGSDSNQTGTEAGGITFNTLPSECTIKIYTLSGELARTLHHSDLGGTMQQEVWDVKTQTGDPVASGVYLWRVESSVDSKNGKLMVIR